MLSCVLVIEEGRHLSSHSQFHVTAGAKPREISGYVITSSSSTTNETVYAVDCEMCYTTAGLELTRVSVVDMELQPVYEAIVLPPRPIVDYNTRYIVNL